MSGAGSSASTHVPPPGFRRSLGILLSGTAIGQAIALLATPILARLFSPADYGVLGTFSAIAGILIVIAGLRLEQAIVIPPSDDESKDVLALSLVVVGGSSAIVAAGLLAHSLVARLIGWDAQLPASYGMLPLMVGATGAYQAVNYWSTRQGQFTALARTRVTRSLGTVALQLVAGVAALGGAGLVLGQVGGQAIATIVLILVTVTPEVGIAARNLSLPQLRSTFLKHRVFALFGAPQAVVNAASVATPAITFGIFFSSAALGLYWFAYRLLQMPIELVGQSVRQVFINRASALVRGGASTYPIWRTTTLWLALVGVIPVALIAVAGPLLFDTIFGAEWRDAGEYARWLSIWLYFVLLNPPSSSLLMILGRQKSYLVYELLLLLTRIVVCMYGGLALGPLVTVKLLAVVGVAFNLYLIFYARHSARMTSAVTES